MSKRWHVLRQIFTSEEVELPRSAVADYLEEIDPSICARYLVFLIEERAEVSHQFHDRLAELYLAMTLAAKKRGDESAFISSWIYSSCSRNSQSRIAKKLVLRTPTIYWEHTLLWGWSNLRPTLFWRWGRLLVTRCSPLTCYFYRFIRGARYFVRSPRKTRSGSRTIRLPAARLSEGRRVRCVVNIRSYKHANIDFKVLQEHLPTKCAHKQDLPDSPPNISPAYHCNIHKLLKSSFGPH